jgi:hypothetical protein
MEEGDYVSSGSNRLGTTIALAVSLFFLLASIGAYYFLKYKIEKMLAFG